MNTVKLFVVYRKCFRAVLFFIKYFLLEHGYFELYITGAVNHATDALPRIFPNLMQFISSTNSTRFVPNGGKLDKPSQLKVMHYVKCFTLSSLHHFLPISFNDVGEFLCSLGYEIHPSVEGFRIKANISPLVPL